MGVTATKRAGDGAAPAAPPMDAGNGGAGIGALEELLGRWRRMDKRQDFWHPVTEAQAPGYHHYVSAPMSFDRMQEKVRLHSPCRPVFRVLFK